MRIFLSPGRRMGAALAGLAAVVLLVAACGSGSSSRPAATGAASAPGSGTGTITWWASPITTSGTDPRQLLIAAFEKAHPQIKIKLVSAPTSTDTNRAALTTQISGGGGPDVYMGDVIWPAQFAHAGLAVNLAKYLPQSYWSRFASGLVKGASYHGGIYGAPFFAGQGLFYYRKDLLAEEHLPVPTTWKQVVSESKQLQAANLVKYGFVWQGASYEGLTCNWMEFASDAGATVLNNSGTKATIDSKASLKALNFMTELIKSGVSPKGEVTFQEPQTTAIFDAGNAAFMRMWDSAYAQAESPTTSKVAGKVGIEPLPTFAGQPKPGYSTVGGWNLYINPHSKNVKADLTFIKFMTSSQAQTILSTYTIPTVQSVRTSKAVTSKSPVLAIIGKTKLIDRPSFSPNYPKVSSAVYTNINAALSGTTSPKSALSTAQSHINSAVSGKSF